MPHSRFDQLATLAEENDGLISSSQARTAGILGSTALTQGGTKNLDLVRLRQLLDRDWHSTYA